MSAIVLPFVAEVEFKKAKELEVNYRWRRAGEIYQAVAHLNPFNAKYFAGAGDFMVRQSKYRKGINKISWFKRARRLYERASQLNPQYADYWYLLGKLQLEMFRLESKEIASPCFAGFAMTIEMSRNIKEEEINGEQ